MSGHPNVTITVVTANETGGGISDVKVVVGGEVIDNLPSLGKGATSLPNQYSGPSGDLSWAVAFTDHAGNKKTGTVGSNVTKADTKAKVTLNAGDFTVTTPSGPVTGKYS